MKEFIASIKSFIRGNIIAPQKESYSQYQQDEWVINEVFNQKKNGYFVEVGSTNGVTNNNTYLLEKKYGWKGICVEPNPLTFEKLKINRKCHTLNIGVDGQDGEVNFIYNYDVGGIVDIDTDNKPTADQKVVKLKVFSLVNILKQHNAPKSIDYLSIDVEGAEERILKNFPFDEYIFKSITIERPTQLLHKLFLSKGYILMKHIPGVDNYYMHESQLSDYLNKYSKVNNKLIQDYIENRAANTYEVN